MTTSYVNFRSNEIQNITYVSGTFYSGKPPDRTDPVSVEQKDGWWKVKVDCDREKSSTVATTFNNQIISENNIWGSKSDSRRPGELNFCFQLEFTFWAPCGQVKTILVVGQGNHMWYNQNDWWIGGGALCRREINNVQIICVPDDDDDATVRQILSINATDVENFDIEGWFKGEDQASEASIPEADSSPSDEDSNSMSLTNSFITAISYIPDSLVVKGKVDSSKTPSISQNGNKWSINLKCNRSGSSDTAKLFREKIVNTDNIYGPNSDERVPGKLNFFFGLSVTFTLAGRDFDVALYFGQGHSKTTNDWWIGGPSLGRRGGRKQATLALEMVSGAIMMALDVYTHAVYEFSLKEFWTSLAPPPSKQDWMKNLPADLRISAVNLPGTHDSAAINGYTRFWTTQWISLTDQFKAGVRLFDIRISVRKIDNTYKFWTCHGDYGLRMGAHEFQTLESALEELNAVLGAYPSEFIVVSLKIDAGNGYNAQDYVPILRNTVQTKLPRINNVNSNPTVGDMRGKAYILNRIPNLSIGAYLGIPNNTTGAWVKDKTSTYDVYVQDQYESWPADKLRLYTAAVDMSIAPDKVLLNFASAVVDDKNTQRLLGIYINSAILNWLGTCQGSQRPTRLGWTFHDFIDEAFGSNTYSGLDIIQLVIDSNSKYSAYPLEFVPYTADPDSRL